MLGLRAGVPGSVSECVGFLRACWGSALAYRCSATECAGSALGCPDSVSERAGCGGQARVRVGLPGLCLGVCGLCAGVLGLSSRVPGSASERWTPLRRVRLPR
ncbi:hypothetical protein GCM10009613_35600 [Pseudonocardia kongjuensis]|uniref:Uncharacterized protein n=1 Tax=Pseudonocardia kongjuensis TaxID=102227 RepID=A0ABP4IQ13_9PSEU